LFVMRLGSIVQALTGSCVFMTHIRTLEEKV